MSRWKPDAQGRLTAAAVTLFEQRGYDDTTIAQIADAAGLTKRTFFRYFTDKREVLFHGSADLVRCWVDGTAAAPTTDGAMAATLAGLADVTTMFEDRHDFARLRAGIVASHPELQERELIKLSMLGGAVAAVLVTRGAGSGAAQLAAQSGVTVFHVAFARWVEQDDPSAFARIIEECVRELRAVTAG